MSILSFFRRSKTDRRDSDDYKVVYSHKSVIITAVASVFLALIIWAVSVYMDAATHIYTSVKIEIRNSSAITDAGFKIVPETETVNFKVKGRKSDIDMLENVPVVAYIDLAGIDASKESATVPVKFESGFNLVYSDISNQEIEVLFFLTQDDK